MTETPVTPAKRLLPPGADALDDLTVAELGIVGRQLRCDPYKAVKDDSTGLRWEALGRIAWLWARRTDAQAKLDPFLQMTPGQVSELLGLLDAADDDEDRDGDGDAAEVNPTDSTPGS